MILLSTADPSKAVRLRTIIAKYRVLAERGKKEKVTRQPVQQPRRQRKR